MIEGSTVTLADVMASNGVIHVIDKVLMPPAPYTGIEFVTIRLHIPLLQELQWKNVDLTCMLKITAWAVKNSPDATIPSLMYWQTHLRLSVNHICEPPVT